MMSMFLAFFVFKRLFVKSCIYKTAIDNLGNEVSINSDIGALMAYKGIFSYLDDDYAKALQYFEESIQCSEVAHNTAFCYDWMANCYDALNKPSEAFRCCVKAVESEPSNLAALFGLADAYARKGLYEKAEYYYRKILREQKDNSAAIFLIGVLYMGQARYEDAEKQFNETIKIERKSGEYFEPGNKTGAALAELSLLSAIKGEYALADSYFSKATENMYSESKTLRKQLDSIKMMKELCEG
jgi:tetratricopeptide (TPR) repeat protein